jgi:plasmid stabilization system protein ParE
MPRIVVTERAGRDLNHCISFLQRESPRAAADAAKAIDTVIGILATTPNIGKPAPEQIELREMLSLLAHPGTSPYTVTTQARMPSTFWLFGINEKWVMDPIEQEAEDCVSFFTTTAEHPRYSHHSKCLTRPLNPLSL